jgi:hypothetical protein
MPTIPLTLIHQLVLGIALPARLHLREVSRVDVVGREQFGMDPKL